jgi:dihydroorotate dehydrogenase subfamily 2
MFFWKERKEVIRWVAALAYPRLVKPLFFLINPEHIHVRMVAMGQMMGNFGLTRFLLAYLLQVKDQRLVKKLAGITFPNPVGLAAGFDYNADLTQILGSVGFGFQSVGTITNGAYGGNPRPMLGRLPKSRSLMVNKGYKNLGADQTIAKLEGKRFPIPVGISIGVTNSEKMDSLEKVIQDIKECFQKFERSQVQHKYYELNISCPNLKVGVSLYDPKHLQSLLTMLDSLKVKRPVFIKMPIEKSDSQYKAMLDVILKHRIAGVIIGNLSKDRHNPAIDPSEVDKYAVGNFSGKPTWESSNHLIEYTRAYVKHKLIIIGCGGIFSPEDAQEKMRRGADVVQLITGMIYQGPQLIGQINAKLTEAINQ